MRNYKTYTLVTEQQNSETEQEMPGPISTKTVTKEIDMITMETKEAVAVEEEKSQSNQPMDLGSPLDSDPEFDLLPGEQDESVDTLTTNEEYAASTSATEDLNTSVKEDVTEEETAEQTGDEEREGETRRDGTEERKGEDEKDEEEDSSSSSGGKRVDRLDSTFDSSYEPATEELLYEGDPDAEAKHDPSQDASTAEGDVSLLVGDREKTADTSVTDKREEEEGFMVEVHYKDQGGSLEDPAAAVIGSTPLSKEDLEEKGGKPSPSVTGKTPGDSSRFVLLCRVPSPFLSTALYSNWSTPRGVLIGAHPSWWQPIRAYPSHLKVDLNFTNWNWTQKMM